MKTKILYVAFLAFIILSISCSTEQVETSTKAEILDENKATATLAIEGMVCANGCAKGIEKELSSVNGIAECTVDFDAENATVVYDKTILEERDIIAIIEDLNDGQYKVTSDEDNSPDAEVSDTLETASSALPVTEKIHTYNRKPKTEFILPLLLNYILNNIAD